MSGEETKLNDATQVVALGYSLVAAISDNAQITFHSAIADDDPDSVANAKIDRIMRIVARQRLLGEKPGIDKELRELEDRLAQLAEDKALAESNYQKAKATLEVQVKTMQDALFKANIDGVAQHTATGRGGKYEPRGAVKASIERAKTGITGSLNALTTLTNDTMQEKHNLGITEGRMNARVEQLKARLAEIEGMT